MIIKQDIYFAPSDDTRRLHIRLPEGYYDTEERYPVMYFFDGHNLFSDEDATYGTSWGLDEYFRDWDKPMICVGLECSHRGRERLKEYCPYHFNDAFFGDLHGTGIQTLDWMVTVLKPYIDRTYRTYSFREATGIGGSSMGGLMSLYAVIRYNSTFSKAACLSSTVTPCLKELREDILRSEMDGDTRVYLSWGTNEGAGSSENLRDDFDSYTARCNRSVRDLLSRKPVLTRLYCQKGGNHCEADWRRQNDRYMGFLWQDR